MADSGVVLDASAAIAFLRGEPTGPSVAQLLREHRARMCTVNAAETVDVLVRVHGWDAADVVLDGERAVPALATGATSTGSVAVTIPADLAAGTYYLLAVADATSVVPEASETNNSTWRQIIVNR